MPRFVAYAWVGRPERGVDLPPSGVVLHLYGPLPCGMPVWFVCRSLPLTSTNDFSDAGNTVPARGHDALPQWRRLFLWMSVLKKEFLKTGDSRLPLVPLDKLEREGGLDSRFFRQAGRLFFAAREAGRRIRPSSWKEAPRARHISLGAGFSPGNRRDFRFGAYASCCPVLRRNRLLSPGFLPDSCILSEPCLFRPPFSIGNGGLFYAFPPWK